MDSSGTNKKFVLYECSFPQSLLLTTEEHAKVNPFEKESVTLNVTRWMKCLSCRSLLWMSQFSLYFKHNQNPNVSSTFSLNSSGSSVTCETFTEKLKILDAKNTNDSLWVELKRKKNKTKKTPLIFNSKWSKHKKESLQAQILIQIWPKLHLLNMTAGPLWRQKHC